MPRANRTCERPNAPGLPAKSALNTALSPANWDSDFNTKRSAAPWLLSGNETLIFETDTFTPLEHVRALRRSVRSALPARHQNVYFAPTVKNRPTAPD